MVTKKNNIEINIFINILMKRRVAYVKENNTPSTMVEMQNENHF